MKSSIKDPAPSCDVSIVIPVYNAGRFLYDCLDSLVEQTIDPSRVEILLIDDGSTDGSGSVCDAYAERYPHLFFVEHVSHTGSPGAVRNQGMRRARGEYILFSDADDWWGRESVERLIAHAREWKSDMIQGRLCNVKNGQIEGMNALFNSEKPSVPNADWRTFQQLTSTLGSIRCFRRLLAIDNEIWWDEDYWFEDLIFSLKLIFASNVCSVANDYNYYYVRRSDENRSISTRQPQPLPIKRPENIVKSITKLFDMLDLQNATNEEASYLLQKFFRHPVILGAEIVEEQVALSPEKYPFGAKNFFLEIWDRVKPYYVPCVKKGLSLEVRCAVEGLAAGISPSELTQLRRVALVGRKPKEIKTLRSAQDSSLQRIEALWFLNRDTLDEFALRQISNITFGMVHRIEVAESKLYMEGDLFFPLYGVENIALCAKLVGNKKSYVLGPVELVPEVFGEKFQYKGLWRINCESFPSLKYLAKEGSLHLVFEVNVGSISRSVTYSKDKAEGCWRNGLQACCSFGNYELTFAKQANKQWAFHVKKKNTFWRI